MACGYADAIDARVRDAISALRQVPRTCSCWSPEPIHGLLQTEDYADAIMEILLASIPANAADAIRRSDRSTDAASGIAHWPAGQAFTFVLDEAALHHRYGSAEVMHNQLLRLNEVSLSPDVTIRVLAFAGQHPVVSPGAFALLEFAPVHGTVIGDVVYMEHLTGHSFVEDDTETAPVPACLRATQSRGAGRGSVTSTDRSDRRRRVGLTSADATNR